MVNPLINEGRGSASRFLRGLGNVRPYRANQLTRWGATK